MKKGLIIAIIIDAILLISGISTYNSLITQKETVDSKISEIDVQLKRRSDLIPNLVNTVKGLMKHEKSIVDSVTEARSALVNASSTAEKLEANTKLTEAINNLYVVVENYPDIKANANFISLQDEIAGTENRIAYARSEYNKVAKEYNTKVKRFPTNIFANILGFDKVEYFEATGAEKEPVNVNFD